MVLLLHQLLNTVSRLGTIGDGTTPGTLCGTGTGCLVQQEQVRWTGIQTNAMGYLRQTASFTTPPINTTTTFYAAAVSSSFNNIQGLAWYFYTLITWLGLPNGELLLMHGVDFLIPFCTVLFILINITNQGSRGIAGTGSGITLRDTTYR